MGYDLHQKKTIKTHYKACLNNKKIKVTSVIDTDENKLTQVTFKKNKIKTYLSSDYILKKRNINMIIISLPTIIHSDFLKKISDTKDLIFVLFEKPFGYNYLLQKKILQDKNTDFKNKIIINYFRNYIPTIIKILNQIKNQFYGTLIEVNIFYKKNNYTNLPHFFSLLSIIWGTEYFNKLDIIKKNKNEICLINNFNNVKINLLQKSSYKNDIHFIFENGNFLNLLNGTKYLKSYYYGKESSYRILDMMTYQKFIYDFMINQYENNKKFSNLKLSFNILSFLNKLDTI